MEKVDFDFLYETPNFYGEAFPLVIEYFEILQPKELVIDFGAGQGRNAIPLAKMGYQVVAIEQSVTAINQLFQISKEQNLNLFPLLCDINKISSWNFICLGAKVILIDHCLEYLQDPQLLLNTLIDFLNRPVKIIIVESAKNIVKLINHYEHHAITSKIKREFQFQNQEIIFTQIVLG